jgi:hypothetical protein
MSRIPILAAAALIAACHSTKEDQTAVSPARADTTAVTHVIDSTRTGPPGTAGRPGNATVTPDSAMGDTTAVKADTMKQAPSPTSTPQDTLGPRNPNATQPTPDTTGTSRP